MFKQNTIDDYFNELVDGVFAVHKELEEKYKPYLKDNWSLERISKTADIAMQIGLFELTSRIDIPKKFLWIRPPNWQKILVMRVMGNLLMEFWHISFLN